MNSGTKALHAFRAPNFSSVVLSTLGRLGVEDAERPTATLHKIHNRPGIDVSAGFQIDFTRAGSAAADYVVVTTSEVPESEHVVRVQHQGLRFAFWLHPFDPELPGLAPACDPVVAAGWTGETSPVLKLASYRPLRRGVVRYRGERTTFAKIVRPTRVERLRARHELISEAGIAPRVLGVPAPGVLLMDSAMGSSLASALAAGLAGNSPCPTRLSSSSSWTVYPWQRWTSRAGTRGPIGWTSTVPPRRRPCRDRRRAGPRAWHGSWPMSSGGNPRVLWCRRTAISTKRTSSCTLGGRCR